MDSSVLFPLPLDVEAIRAARPAEAQVAHLDRKRRAGVGRARCKRAHGAAASTCSATSQCKAIAMRS
jgi:hypothetical protein